MIIIQPCRNKKMNLTTLTEIYPYFFRGYEDVPNVIRMIRNCQLQGEKRQLLVVGCMGTVAGKAGQGTTEEQRELLLAYTNALFELEPRFEFTEDERRRFLEGGDIIDWLARIGIAMRRRAI